MFQPLLFFMRFQNTIYTGAPVKPKKLAAGRTITLDVPHSHSSLLAVRLLGMHVRAPPYVALMRIGLVGLRMVFGRCTDVSHHQVPSILLPW